MHQPRTLIFGLNYPPETTGISPYTGAMAEGLARRGHQVRAVVAHPHYPEWKITSGYGQWSRNERINGVDVQRLRHYVPRQPSLIRRALSEVTLGVRQAIVRWGKPNVIVAVSPGLIASLIVRLRAKMTHRETPFIVWVQDLYSVGLSETSQGAGAPARVIHALEAWLLRSASSVVVIHERFANRLQEDFGVSPHRITVVRNWNHLPPFPVADVAAVRASFGWNEGEIVVVHAGNMGVKQGLHHVVDAGRLAFERGEPVRFVLVGNGSQREEIRQRVNDAQTTTQILPPLDDEAFAQVLQSADVLLVNELPGVAEMAVPSKLTSYFASGRPVLAATDVGGITAQVIRDAGAGLAVAAGDAAAILDGAKALAADREGSTRLGESGKRYKETMLNETRAIDRFDSLLADLIAKDAESPSA
ncbi:glycosyltransferase [Microbacterium testaceum StLB037]|uniref:D-inositol 3-phosphate glycosyltransferase n=1 Tax=Microbacterium testaceum (strain StLB037) TaxID=979556 RepID=E8NFF4_MICTS|nr:glycosyltransferase [Microbacterium testaceum]BAJ75227.1 glycosyltransferase [Microbacterium testaceum StLB037]